MLKIQMLGTGSAFAKQYFNTNALIYAKGYNLLIDCGNTAMQSLHKLDIPLERIDGVWITHIHADHVGGLEELAFRSKYKLQRKLDLYVMETLMPSLWDNCLKGGLINQQDGFVSLEDYYNVIVVKEQHSVIVSEDLIIEPIRTEHVPGKPNYSLYMNNSFFYSGDIQFNPELLEHLYRERGCLLIFHDCQLETPGYVHATLNELLTLPTELQQILWLMHYDDHVNQYHGKTGAMRFLPQHECMNAPAT